MKGYIHSPLERMLIWHQDLHFGRDPVDEKKIGELIKDFKKRLNYSFEVKCRNIFVLLFLEIKIIVFLILKIIFTVQSPYRLLALSKIFLKKLIKKLTPSPSFFKGGHCQLACVINALRT
jgi:hypothetical protein